MLRSIPVGGDDPASDGAFTLIELLVVLLVLGILLGVAIPTFLAVTRSASVATAQSNIQIAFTGATSYFEQNDDSYAGITTGTAAASPMSALGLSMTFVADGPSTDSATIGVSGADQQLMIVAFAPRNHACYALFDTRVATAQLAPFGGSSFADAPGGGSSVAGGTWYGWFDSSGATSGSSACSVDDALSLVAKWQSGSFPRG